MTKEQAQTDSPELTLAQLPGEMGDYLGVPAVLFDQAGNVLDQSESFKKLLTHALTGNGKPNWLALGRNFIGAISPQQGLLQLEEALTVKGQSCTYRLILRPVPYQAANQMQVNGLLVTFQDITEMTRYRDLYQMMRQQFLDMTRLVSDWVWETDPDLKFKMVSGRITAVLGYPEHQIIKSAIGDIIQSSEDHLGDLTQIMTERHPFREHHAVIQDYQGQDCYFLVSGLPIYDQKSGDFIGYRGVARDISEQRQAQRQAALYQQHLSNAIQSISEGFELYTEDDELLMCNDKVHDFWPEISPYLTPGRKRQDLLEYVAQKNLISTEQLEQWQSHFTLPDTREKPFEIHTQQGRWFSLYQRQVQGGGCVIISSDITEAKTREYALLQAKEMAEIANRSKTDFLANISHELRTPMNAIIGFSQLMQEEMLGPIEVPQYREYLGNILESAHHLLSLINDLLDVSRAELGQHTLIEEEVDLAQALSRTFNMVRERAWKQNIQFTLQIESDKLVILGDGRKIKQILLNLVSNAIKFTPEKGTIILGVQDLGSDGIEIYVEDSGIGMREDQIPIALAPFGQIDSSLNRKFEGTGLGLPLSNALAKLHDSHLKIVSHPGEGTRVSFTLPNARRLGRS